MGQQSQGKVLSKSEGAHRLAELGAPIEILNETARAIAVNRGSADEYCPVQAPGMMGWIGGVKFFRNGFVNVGGTLNNKNGFSSVISHDGQREFFIMSGASGVGRVVDGKQPRSKAPRGLQTIRRVEANQMSFPADVLMVEVDDFGGNFVAREHWCLLYYVGKNMIYSEFSKPTVMDKDGFVVEWSERIILEPIPIVSEHIVVGENEAAPTIDVSVTLKENAEDAGVQSGETKISS